MFNFGVFHLSIKPTRNQHATGRRKISLSQTKNPDIYTQGKPYTTYTYYEYIHT